MLIVGKRFSTIIDSLQGHQFIIKSMDLVAPRQPVLCYREYLGYLLGRTLSLDIPPTALALHPTYGRISLQTYIPNCRPITPTERDHLVFTPLGRRILMLDLLIHNSDRRNDNLITNGDRLLPIDFNVAFNFHPDTGDSTRDYIIKTWFGLHNLVQLQQRDRPTYLQDAELIRQHLTDQFLTAALDDIDPRFCPDDDKHQVLHNLQHNRDQLPSLLDQFWSSVILPDTYQPEVQHHYEQLTNRSHRLQPAT